MRFLSTVLAGLALAAPVLGFRNGVQQITGAMREVIHVERKLKHIVDLFKTTDAASEQRLLDELRSSYPIAPTFDTDASLSASDATASLPVVFLHGMGDSCYNSGMASLATVTAKFLNTYSVCIPGGDNALADTLSAFLVTMDKNIEDFNTRVAADGKLANGFYAVGLSQGNLVIRGYQQKYNNPPVVKALHIHGTLEGVSAFPHCPNTVGICQTINKLLGDIAYNPLSQGLLFQANYYRDPLLTNTTAYRQYSQIAQWNGEGETFDPAFKTNFLKTQSLTFIKALADKMIDPKESEWYGSYQGDFTHVVPVTQTPWFVQDTFGLQTLSNLGRLSYNTSVGDHLQFSQTDMENWMLQAGFGQ